MESVDGSPCLRISSWAHRTNLSSPHFLSNEMKIKDDRGSKTNSWLYINTEPNQFPHILGQKWKHSDKRFIIKRIIIRKRASQIGCELSLTASIRSWKMAVWDLPLVESNHIFVKRTLYYALLIKHKKTLIYGSRDGFPNLCSEVVYYWILDGFFFSKGGCIKCLRKNRL